MILEDMEESTPLNVEKTRKRNELKAELMKILDNEELYWYKRCHETCLLKGDNNTEFFHKVANGRKRKQSFHCKMVIQGLWGMRTLSNMQLSTIKFF